MGINNYKTDVFAILKAMAIIAVVAGHTMYAPVEDFVYLFHIPLFYFCTGYFFKDRYIYNKLDFIKGRFKRLYIPAFCYGLLFLLLYNIFFSLNLYSDQYGYLNYVSHVYTQQDYIKALRNLLLCDCWGCGNLLAAMWFVRSILICSIAFCFFVYFAKLISVKYENYVLGLIVFGVAITLNWVPFDYYTLPLKENIAREMACGVPMMFFGRIFHFVKLPDSLKFVIPSTVASFVILIILIILDYDNSVGDGWYRTSLIVHYLVSLVGIFFIYNCAIYIRMTPLAPPLKIVGKYTFEIMALHFLAFKLVSLLQVWIYGYDIVFLSKFPVIEFNTWIWWIPYTIVGVGVPILYMCAVEKMKMILSDNKVFLLWNRK